MEYASHGLSLFSRTLILSILRKFEEAVAFFFPNPHLYNRKQSSDLMLPLIAPRSLKASYCLFQVRSFLYCENRSDEAEAP